MTTEKEKKVMAFGTFDGLHKGHLSYFRQAKRLGDYLIVVVARNKNVLKTKKHLPVYDEKDRLKAIKECGLANKAVLGTSTSNLFDIIKKHQPDIACLGYDQQTDTKRLKATFPDIRIVRLKAYQPEIYKSSVIAIRQLAEKQSR